MKQIVISLIAMGAASFGFAQQSYPDFDPSKFRELGAIASNDEYLKDVQSDLTPNQVKFLENLVSYWGVAKSEEFDGRNSNANSVTFMLENGQITASYNSKGGIVSAIERFRNFAMPKSVSKEILREYPDWKIVKNRYSVFYRQNNSTKRLFKVLIQKGTLKKWVRVDPSGSIS